MCFKMDKCEFVYEMNPEIVHGTDQDKFLNC